MTTTADLAADLGVDEGDVNMLLNQLGESERFRRTTSPGSCSACSAAHERTGEPPMQTTASLALTSRVRRATPVSYGGAGAHKPRDVLAVTAFSAADHHAQRNPER